MSILRKSTGAWNGWVLDLPIAERGDSSFLVITDQIVSVKLDAIIAVRPVHSSWGSDYPSWWSASHRGKRIKEGYKPGTQCCMVILSSGKEFFAGVPVDCLREVVFGPIV